MASIRLPDTGTFYDWFIDLNLSKPNLIIPTPINADKDWWESAMLLIALNKNTLSNVCLPLRTTFKDYESWRTWAYFFIQNTTF